MCATDDPADVAPVEALPSDATGRVREACGQDALALARITGGAPA